MQDKPEIRRMEYVFCRFHIEGLFSHDVQGQMKEFLSDSKSKYIYEERYQWAFGDIAYQTINNDEIILGRLGRTITKRFGTVYDEEQHSYRKELIKSGEAAYANFFVIPKKYILVIEDKYNLRRNVFVKKFKEFWGKNGGNYTDIQIEFIKDEVEIFEIVSTWDRLSKATFNLVPSNPSSREDWKDVDELIQKAKAKRAKLEFENKDKEGLAREKSIIQTSMSMAADGYGEFKLKGWKGSVGQSFSSISKIMRKEIHSVDELPAILGQIYKEIINVLGGPR